MVGCGSAVRRINELWTCAPANRPPSMRYQLLLPLTSSPRSSESTFTCSPPLNSPTIGASVLGAARTLAALATPHHPPLASSAAGTLHCCASGLVVLLMER